MKKYKVNYQIIDYTGEDFDNEFNTNYSLDEWNLPLIAEEIGEDYYSDDPFDLDSNAFCRVGILFEGIEYWYDISGEHTTIFNSVLVSSQDNKHKL